MDEIRAFADMSVRRGCGFAGLAVITVVIGLSFDPVLAAKSGAILTSMMTAVLAWMAHLAPQQPYRRTEVWLMLDGKSGLSDEAAQRVVGQALRDSYLLHAEMAAYVALCLWVVALICWVAL